MASVLELAFATALMMVPIHRAKLGEINGIPRWRRLRGGLDLLAFGDQNMTLPSVEEMKEQIRAHHERFRTGTLHSSEKDTEPEPLEFEGRIDIIEIPEKIPKGYLEELCRRYGEVRKFYMEGGGDIYRQDKKVAYAIFPNITNAELAAKRIKREPWVADGRAQVFVGKTQPSDSIEEYDPGRQIYDTKYKPDSGMQFLSTRGYLDKKGRRERQGSSSEEKYQRRKKGNLRMDALADFEKEKLNKLIKEFPELVFPDNFCEDENGWTLYIGRIPVTVDGKELEEVFSRYGRITRCKVGKSWERATKKFGFVSFRTAEGCCRALKDMQELDYRFRENQAPIVVKFAMRFVPGGRKSGRFQEDGTNEMKEMLEEKFREKHA